MNDVNPWETIAIRLAKIRKAVIDTSSGARAVAQHGPREEQSDVVDALTRALLRDRINDRMVQACEQLMALERLCRKEALLTSDAHRSRKTRA